MRVLDYEGERPILVCGGGVDEEHLPYLVSEIDLVVET
jgi:hypothetical protein